LQGRLLWPLIIGLGLVLIALVLGRDDGLIAGMSQQEFAGLAVKVALGILVGSLVLAAFRRRLSEALQAALLWAALAGLLAVGYAFRGELRSVGERGGEFVVETKVNDARVGMVLDSGASSVVLTPEAAKTAGLPLQVLSYSVTIETANGRARAAPVMLDRIAVGAIVERSVPALVAQPGQLRVSLLGMSFINRLASWEVRSDRLLMRPH
jgi:aspartyl protease family protein